MAWLCSILSKRNSTLTNQINCWQKSISDNLEYSNLQDALKSLDETSAVPKDSSP